MWRVTGRIVSCVPPQLNYCGEITIEKEDCLTYRYKIKATTYQRLYDLFEGSLTNQRIVFSANAYDEIETAGKPNT